MHLIYSVLDLFWIVTEFTKHTFLIITWIISLQFSCCWVLWMYCRCGHIFLIYTLYLNVEDQDHTPTLFLDRHHWIVGDGWGWSLAIALLSQISSLFSKHRINTLPFILHWMMWQPEYECKNKWSFTSTLKVCGWDGKAKSQLVELIGYKAKYPIPTCQLNPHGSNSHSFAPANITSGESEVEKI